jgi:hypothetical protein
LCLLSVSVENFFQSPPTTPALVRHSGVAKHANTSQTRVGRSLTQNLSYYAHLVGRSLTQNLSYYAHLVGRSLTQNLSYYAHLVGRSLTQNSMRWSIASVASHSNQICIKDLLWNQSTFLRLTMLAFIAPVVWVTTHPSRCPSTNHPSISWAPAETAGKYIHR